MIVLGLGAAIIAVCTIAAVSILNRIKAEGPFLPTF
ncbi:hypothetical protein QO005_002930 [Rhizobium paknamense]|uniref:Uncharacterized protein n=1 Tax=Rhizobium paknamense TaxID=1206817 RepID=A0ABU0IEC2_9HYPH|nr:hypothetical protein [Rhizobium paknamense]